MQKPSPYETQGRFGSMIRDYVYAAEPVSDEGGCITWSDHIKNATDEEFRQHIGRLQDSLQGRVGELILTVRSRLYAQIIEDVATRYSMGVIASESLILRKSPVREVFIDTDKVLVTAQQQGYSDDICIHEHNLYCPEVYLWGTRTLLSDDIVDPDINDSSPDLVVIIGTQEVRTYMDQMDQWSLFSKMSGKLIARGIVPVGACNNVEQLSPSAAQAR